MSNLFPDSSATPKPTPGQLGQMAKGVDSPDNGKSEISRAYETQHAKNAQERAEKAAATARRWKGE